jgi:hypothetical protein
MSLLNTLPAISLQRTNRALPSNKGPRDPALLDHYVSKHSIPIVGPVQGLVVTVERCVWHAGPARFKRARPQPDSRPPRKTTFVVKTENFFGELISETLNQPGYCATLQMRLQGEHPPRLTVRLEPGEPSER